MLASPPAVILVRPQLPENIGMVARAMWNCGLSDLRLVRPRRRWPDARGVAAATGAAEVAERARLFPSVEEAIADLHCVFATTARPRDQVKRIVTARAAGKDLRRRAARGQSCGLLFGPERTGLENDEVALADVLVTVPLNPEFSSLNLAQAVFVVAYEWFQAAAPTLPASLAAERGEPATRRELLGFFKRLEDELDACGFLHHPQMRPIMVRNIRNLFHRAGLVAQEVRTLHGVVTGLTRRPHVKSAQRTVRSWQRD